MDVAALLSIQLTLDGLNRVLDGLNAYTNGLNEAESSLLATQRTAAVAGAAMAAVGLGVSFASIQAYESVEKLRRGFANMLGEAEGTRLADEIRTFSVEANASGAALQQIARTWVGLTGDSTKVMDLLRGMEKMSAGVSGPDALVRGGRAFGQIQAAGRFRAEELNQLIDAEMPVSLIAKELGLSNIRDALGMESSRFMDAAFRAIEKMPTREPLFMQRLANTVESLNMALAPTGALLTAILAPAAWLADRFVSLFGAINNVTGGAFGLVAVLALIVFGFRLMLPFLINTGRAAFGLSTQATVTTGALTELATAAMVASRNLLAGSGGSAAAQVATTATGSAVSSATQGGIAGFFTSMWSRIIGFFTGLWGRILTAGTMLGAMFTKLGAILAPVATVLGVVAAVAGVLAGAFVAIVYAIERFVNWIRPGTITPENSMFGPGMRERIADPQRWTEAAYRFVGVDYERQRPAERTRVYPSPVINAPPAERPYRRSSSEAAYSRAMGTALTGA